MPAVIVSIADAVTAALNGASLSQSFTATRVYVPVHTLRDLADLTVSVVPASIEGSIIDRSGRNLNTVDIHVGVQKVIGQGQMTDAQINAACDQLMLLAEEIGDLFTGQQLASTPVTRCIDAKNIPIYSPPHIDEKRVFLSLVTLSFRYGQ